MEAADGFQKGKSREHRKSPSDSVKVRFSKKVNDEDSSPSEKEQGLTGVHGGCGGDAVSITC